MAFLTASYCLTLSALKSTVLRLYLSIEIRETMNTILYFIDLNSTQIASAT